LLIQEGFILFMDDGGKLIFRDIFDEKKMYKEIVRGFSPTAVPSDAITNAELNDKELMIEYYEGTEFLEKKEYFTLE
ncbi:hypothetical protein, partial [Paenibacillus sp. P46E]|uniref:hypothetical protein n=1 Tax=Paenibacillus sp. P46E TaxID=1349436 RepID=UPI001C4A5730